MIAPFGAPKFSEALRMGVEVFHTLKKVLKKTRLLHRGRRRRRLRAQSEVQRRSLEVVLEAITQAGYKPGEQIGICLDPASSEFFKDGKYVFKKSDKSERTSRADGRVLGQLGAPVSRIISIEDGMAEDDWDGWKLLTDTLGDKIQLVGDDLFVTNTERLKRGIDDGIANSILIKVNQIGTLTETLDAMQMAASAGYTAVVSHRSGETEDPFIADLAVATNAGQIKTGSASRTDRIAKYNQLLRIEERLGASAAVPRQKGVPADDEARTGPPRRKHLEQGEPLHRLDRRRPVGEGPPGGARKAARC